jgi:hypothetical protein
MHTTCVYFYNYLYLIEIICTFCTHAGTFAFKKLYSRIFLIIAVTNGY